MDHPSVLAQRPQRNKTTDLFILRLRCVLILQRGATLLLTLMRCFRPDPAEDYGQNKFLFAFLRNQNRSRPYAPLLEKTIEHTFLIGLGSRNLQM